MNRADILRADVSLKRFDGGSQSVQFAQVIPGSESVRRVEADTETEFRTCFDNLSKMLEALADAFALPRSVFQQNTKRAEVQTITGNLQALLTRADTVCFARATRD